jgi:hypothetical protein
MEVKIINFIINWCGVVPKVDNVLRLRYKRVTDQDFASDTTVIFNVPVLMDLNLLCFKMMNVRMLSLRLHLIPDWFCRLQNIIILHWRFVAFECYFCLN